MAIISTCAHPKCRGGLGLAMKTTGNGENKKRFCSKRCRKNFQKKKPTWFQVFLAKRRLSQLRSHMEVHQRQMSCDSKYA